MESSIAETMNILNFVVRMRNSDSLTCRLANEML